MFGTGGSLQERCVTTVVLRVGQSFDGDHLDFFGYLLPTMVHNNSYEVESITDMS